MTTGLAHVIMGQVDLIFTNPPFGSKIPIDEPSILEAYDLGHTWSYEWRIRIAGPVRMQSRSPSHPKSCSSSAA